MHVHEETITERLLKNKLEEVTRLHLDQCQHIYSAAQKWLTLELCHF